MTVFKRIWQSLNAARPRLVSEPGRLMHQAAEGMAVELEMQRDRLDSQCSRLAMLERKAEKPLIVMDSLTAAWELMAQTHGVPVGTVVSVSKPKTFYTRVPPIWRPLTLRESYGIRVGYAPKGGSNCPLWTGIVIPRPTHATRYGVTGEEFVYVVRDHDYAIRGCYPGRLIKV